MQRQHNDAQVEPHNKGKKDRAGKATTGRPKQQQGGQHDNQVGQTTRKGQ